MLNYLVKSLVLAAISNVIYRLCARAVELEKVEMGSISEIYGLDFIPLFFYDDDDHVYAMFDNISRFFLKPIYVIYTNWNDENPAEITDVYPSPDKYWGGELSVL